MLERSNKASLQLSIRELSDAVSKLVLLTAKARSALLDQDPDSLSDMLKQAEHEASTTRQIFDSLEEHMLFPAGLDVKMKQDIQDTINMWNQALEDFTLTANLFIEHTGAMIYAHKNQQRESLDEMLEYRILDEKL